MIEPDEQPIADDRRKRSLRTDDCDVRFVEGFAVGWRFGVPECFRSALDILFMERVDRAETKAAKRANKTAKSIKRWVWTRGVKPQLAFSRGDVFYEPANIRGQPWGEMTKLMTRSLQVLAAEPDAALAGWVAYELDEWSDGARVSQTTGRCSQAAFANLLKNGSAPDTSRAAAEDEE